ncbi:MAG: hypothetical protein JSV91_12650 [Phycisphaerales bacterium]|nr:MAG: hypothetical protein JSV91_12650 [Phycisphaerales bacterium]
MEYITFMMLSVFVALMAWGFGAAAVSSRRSRLKGLMYGELVVLLFAAGAMGLWWMGASLTNSWLPAPGDLGSDALVVFLPMPMAMGALLFVPPKRHIPGLSCPMCDYDLTGNVSGVCPECGCKLDKPLH